VLSALALLTALSFGFPVWLSGWSMEPALANGSLMLVDRLEPELVGVHRGDIVVFIPLPDTAGGYTSLTKRVIGLPGDLVMVGDGEVSVDGQRLAEPYVEPSQRAAMDGTAHVWLVPPGHVFVLGDARDRSLDSRYFGPVPISRIVGRVWMVLPTPFTHP
jgi:signal peptidase I